MRKGFAAAAVALSVLAAGCSTGVGDKSGGSVPPRVLVLASNDGQDISGAPAVARFVDRVREVSGGRLNVRVVTDWEGGGNEARVIRAVAAGKADLGWSGTRAFDTVGITAFQPLHAPFLVGSYPAEAAVVKDGVSRDMLAGLHSLGLTGLALAADELRVPAAADKPLLTPADFRGLRFGTVRSAVQERGLRALGAHAVGRGTGRVQITDELDGVETMWWTYLQLGQFDVMPFVTVNAALWPRTVAIFANTGRLDALDRTARGWLERAAADAATWSTLHASDKVGAQLNEVCSRGVRVATASPAQLAALRSAAEPAYAVMRADPELAGSMRRIETLVSSVAQPAPTPVPAACSYHPGDEKRMPAPERRLTGPGNPGGLPQGTYRYSFTVEELLPHVANRYEAEINAGVFDWTLNGGRWHYTAKLAISGPYRPGAYTSCDGWYDVQGNVARFTTTTVYSDGDCAPPQWSARWELHRSTLTWSAVSVPDFAYVWAGKPWQRIA